MIAKQHFIAIAFGACLLGLSALASEKNPVERPQKGVGQFHVIINVGFPFGTGDLSYVAIGTATGTHGGLSHSRLEGFAAFGPDGGITLVTGSGAVTVANGDKFYMRLEPDGSVTINGGTGRFEGATGSQTATNVGDPVAVYDPATGTLTIDVTQMIEGTITY